MPRAPAPSSTAPRPDLVARTLERVAQRANEAGLRRLEVAARGAPAHTLVVEGRVLENYAGNDYLALSDHPAVRAAAIACVAREGVGAMAAHLLGGHRPEHDALERELAEWTERPAALLFSTGYHANLGVIGALLGADDLCVQDKLDHASLVDAAQLAGCELARYPHGDVDACARQLAARPDRAALVSTDGVFSMDGTIAPLAALAAVCRRERALLHVDDAHGIGVLGPSGYGAVDEAGLGVGDVPLLMATLGKALGTFGAFVAGSREMVDALVQFARPFVYTTAMPPVLAAATRASVRVARHEHWRRDKLARLVRHFRRGAVARGLALLDSRTPIQPIVIGDSDRALAVSRALRERGYHVPAVRPPTVPRNSARLRVTLSVFHSEAGVERLLDVLAESVSSHERDARNESRDDARHARRAPRARGLRVRDRP